MPTPTQVKLETRPLPWAAPDFAHLALKTRAELPHTQNPGLDAALRITSILQTTLDIEKVFTLFVEELKNLVPCDGVSYRHTGEGIDLTLGRAARYTCGYRLIVGEEIVGEVSITRKKKDFKTEELELTEWLLCALVHPLRNGLLYRAALQASLRDPLTGAGNRAALESHLAREVDIARRHGTPLSIIALDVDHFKLINDEHGHATGDEVLKNIAAVTTGLIRKSDMLLRYGGEEFVIILSNTSQHGALLLAERIRAKLERTQHCVGPRQVSATVSLGVAFARPDDDPQALFARADQALYQAKRDGRNCVRLAVQHGH